MPYIPNDAICKNAGLVILHAGFEAVAAVSEAELAQMLDAKELQQCFGSCVDPYRTIRGPGVGSPNIF